MAAVATRLMSIPEWNPAEMTHAAWDGTRRIRIWEKVINHNNSNSPNPLFWRAAVGVCGSLFMTQFKASDVLSPLAEMGNPGALFFKNYENAFTAATVALVVLNGITIFANQTNKNVSDVPSQMQKFRIGVWKVTPYLMLVTNIALFIIDIPRNKVVGLISLTTAGITLIDLTSWKPKDFDWYLDIGVRVPLDLAVMYYYEESRVPILISLAMDHRIRQTFDNCVMYLF